MVFIVFGVLSGKIGGVKEVKALVQMKNHCISPLRGCSSIPLKAMGLMRIPLFGNQPVYVSLVMAWLPGDDAPAGLVYRHLLVIGDGVADCFRHNEVSHGAADP